jgi:hypothetical protein
LQNTIRFEYGERKHTLKTPLEEDMDHCIRHLLLTHTELETAFSRKEQMYLCTIQQEEGITQATVPGEIQAVLDNYADVLRGLPSGLPPSRAVAQSIELEPGHAPPL